MIDADLKTLLDVCSRNPSDRTGLLVCADRAQETEQRSLEFLLRALAERPQDPPFLFTGSRCYGAPHEDSDWDWVVMLSDAFGDKLHDQADASTWSPRGFGVTRRRLLKAEYQGKGISAGFQFGPVNVIGVRNQPQWDAWEHGTANLLIARDITGEPITRGTAVACFSAFFEKL